MQQVAVTLNRNLLVLLHKKKMKNMEGVDKHQSMR